MTVRERKRQLAGLNQGSDALSSGKRLASPSSNAMHVMVSPRIDDALLTLKNVFLEVPSARLSINDACRLTGLDEPTCLALLLALEQARFLWRSRTGRFLLRADWTSTES